MRFNIKLLVTVITVFALCGCKKDNPGSSKGVDVYVAGTVTINTHSVPAYWKNGQIKVVDDTLSDSWLSPRIAVNGSDVYLVGRDASMKRPVYWKNGGKPTALDLGGYTVGDANGVVFVGNDMYISGFVSNGSTVEHAAYWKNGALNLLNTTTSQSAGYDAFTNGSDVYFTGIIAGAYVVWKNGGSPVIYHNSLAIFSEAWNGSNFYAAGESGNLAAYSINSAITMVPNGKEITGILTNGTDVFMCGIGHDLTTPGGDDLRPMYWKNNVPTQLSKSYGFAEGISMDGADVYIAGYLVDNSPYKFLGAYYWKNGVAVQLNSPANNVERIVAITVKR